MTLLRPLSKKKKKKENLLVVCVLTIYKLHVFLGFMQEDFPHGAHHREIAISISNSTLKHGDAGLVIIGGRMEMQHHVRNMLVFIW